MKLILILVKPYDKIELVKKERKNRVKDILSLLCMPWKGRVKNERNRDRRK